MTDPREYSPFYKIRRTLVVLRWMLGFPLQKKNEYYTEFKFMSWLEWLRFTVMFLLPFSSLFFVLIVILIVDGNFDNLKSELYKSQELYTTSKTDSIAFFIWSLVVVPGTWFVYVLLFKRNILSINQFCNEVIKIKSTMNAMVVKNDEKRKQPRKFTCRLGEVETSEKLLIYGQLLSILASCFTGGWGYINSPVLRFGYHIVVAYAFFLVISMHFIAFGSISAAAEVIICQVIICLIDLFQEWKEILENNPDVHPIRKEKTNITDSSSNKQQLYKM